MSIPPLRPRCRLRRSGIQVARRCTPARRCGLRRSVGKTLFINTRRTLVTPLARHLHIKKIFDK